MHQIQLHAPRRKAAAAGLLDADVRIATADDLRGVARLFDAYRVFYGRSSNRRAARLFLADRMARGESVILVARTRPTDRAPAADVGFAQLYRTFSSVRLGASLILNDLYVIAEARRRGVGARLVDACTAYARTARVVSLQLETRPDNAAAMRLYVGKGFVADTEFARLSFPLELPVLSRSPAR